MPLRSGSARKLLSAVLLAALAWGFLASPCAGAHLDAARCGEVRLSSGCGEGTQSEPGHTGDACPCPCSQAAELSAAPGLGPDLLAASFPSTPQVHPDSVAVSPPLRVPIA